MRSVRNLTNDLVRVNLIVNLTLQRPAVDATTLFPTRAHFPRTSHVRRPVAFVATSESRGVEEFATRVAVVHDSRGAATVVGAACALTGIAAVKAATVKAATRRRRMRRVTSIRITQAIGASTHLSSYLARMEEQLSGATMNGIVVVAVTRDHAEVWSLDERQRRPIAVVARHNAQAEHRHVRTGQFDHGHTSNEGFDGFFSDIALLLEQANEVMIAGHGVGRANAMESLAGYLKTKRPMVFAKVTELRYLDLPHTTGRELAALARKWKDEQRVVGVATEGEVRPSSGAGVSPRGRGASPARRRKKSP